MDNRTPFLLGLVVLHLALASHFSVCPAQASATPKHPKSLSFYFYIAVQNDTNPSNTTSFTAILSAQPAQTQPFSFGNIHTFDTPITTKPSLSSKHIGKAQGWYGDVGQQSMTLFLSETFVVDTKKLKGTFSMLGLYGGTALLQSSPIVGGTGDFALARGVATHTFVSSTTINDETVAWFHYDVEFSY